MNGYQSSHISDNLILDFAFIMCKMNHFEAHLMISSIVLDSKVLRMAIHFNYFSAK